jgi:hypothetical protein
VRQLENLCHWLTVMAPGQAIEIADLPPELRAQAPRETEADWKVALGAEADRLLAGRPGAVWDSLAREFERTLIRHALLGTAGRRIEAAQSARHRPQHHHAQDPGTGDGRLLADLPPDDGRVHVLAADVQTSGRGRRGRAWKSWPGASLTFSALWRFAPDAPVPAGLSLVAGLAVARALEELGVEGVQLKWPQ